MLMKYISKKATWMLAAALMLLSGCEEFNSLDLEPVETGSASFEHYVSVGNSITAGIQNNALYRSAQGYTYGNMIARQLRMEASFTQPLISDPGIGERIELTSLDPLAVRRNQNQGQPLTQDQKPFRNMGVPGAVLVDFLNPDNEGSLKERATNPDHPSFNPFYSIVMEESELQKDAPNLFNQVAKQDPTFVTFWLGNNDVLGYVLAGGEGTGITPPGTFNELYQESADSLSSTEAGVTVYTVPDVTTIPFVFYLRLQLEQQGLIREVDPDGEGGQLSHFEMREGLDSWDDIYIETNNGVRVMRQFDFPLLTATDYVAGLQSGDVPPPITPGSAVPDRLVLDGWAGGPRGNSELEQAASAVTQYNNTIRSVAASHGFALVDMNEQFSRIVENFRSSGGEGGYEEQGVVLRPVPGELFSFDGVHPSNKGHAAIANETIQVINSEFGAAIPEVNIDHIPAGLPQHQPIAIEAPLSLE